ncbi:hypothetical protein [Lysobacter sp. 1R34A]|uniref:hypothetical protein n=1 Tax=Lysobacter sp. 1R34A TaxID=3445786 RepID=UPI003EEB7646
MAHAVFAGLSLLCVVCAGCEKKADLQADARGQSTENDSAVKAAEAAPNEAVAGKAPAKQDELRSLAPTSAVAAAERDANRKALDLLADDIRAGRAGSDEVRDLERLFSQEQRDEAWASSSEYTISNVVANLSKKYGPGLEIAKVECRQTLCEVQAVNRSGVGGSQLDWNRAYLQLKQSLKSSNSQTLMRPLPHGRVVYHTYIIR